ILPSSIAFDATGGLLIAERTDYRIRRVDPQTGIIATVAGNGIRGYSGDKAAATDAQLSSPSGVAVDPFGNIVIADKDNNRIRRVSPQSGIITTIGGNGQIGFSGDGGLAIAAVLKLRGDVTGGYSGVLLTSDSSGNVFLPDVGNHRIRRIDY